MTQLSLGYRNHWTKFILNMAFYWLLGFYLPSFLSTAPHIVGILRSPGGCLKSVWDSFWAHALWDNASVCNLFPTLPTSSPGGWQLCYGWCSAPETEPCQMPWPPSTLPHRKEMVFFLVLCSVGERPHPAGVVWAPWWCRVWWLCFSSFIYSSLQGKHMTSR